MLLSLLFLAAAAVPAPSPEPASETDLLRRARALASAGRYGRAVALLEDGREADPDDVELRHLLGRVYARLVPPQVEAARAELEAALRLEPGRAAAAADLADLLVDAGRPEEAERFLRRRLEAHAGEGPSLWRLGVLRLDAGDEAGARRLLVRATELDPEEAPAWLALGRSRLRGGDPERALPALERARDLAPEEARIRYALAQAYELAGRPEEAGRQRAAYERLLAAAARGGRQEQLRDRVQRAIVLHEVGLEDDPRRPVRWYLSLAALYRASGDLEAGRRFLEELAREHADWAAPLVGAALLEREAGDPERAWALLEAALEREPRHAGALRVLVELAGTAERRAALAARLRRLEGQGGAPVAVPVGLARLAMAAGRPEEAEAALARALERDPVDRDALRDLGVLYGETGRAGEALAAFDRLTAAHPSYGEGWFNLALTEVRLGRRAEAREHLRRALQEGARQPRVLNLLAGLLLEEGRGGEALPLLERSLAADGAQPEVQALVDRLRPVREGG